MARWIAAMRAERYAEAWALRDLTLRERDPATCDDPTLPYHLRWVWDGRAVDGRHVLVRCYHGLGDTIQYLRFLPLLVRRAASVTLEVQPSLLELAAQIADVAVVPFDQKRPLPPSDVTLEITELDFALRASPHDAAPPYLSAQPATLRQSVIGLCYGAGDWDAERAVPATFFSRLCRSATCITLVPEATSLDVLNPQGCPFDMHDTASLVAATEVVITVDTMIAHLAGAMGKPTWLLLKAEPDWRWAPDLQHSPWYPATRLYRQPEAGNWSAVLSRVERDLAETALITAEA